LRRVILAIIATAVVLFLLLSFKSHTQTGVSGASAVGTPTPGGGSAGSASAGAGASATAAPAQATAGKSGAAATVTGAAWPTIYGPVQVRITVSGGKITAVNVLEYPTETQRDVQINAFAIPELNAETLAAGSAKIDTVSGATYTSGGYIGSLQNALDKADAS
jgi:uncharacterized protein with FMN-binding domain